MAPPAEALANPPSLLRSSGAVDRAGARSAKADGKADGGRRGNAISSPPERPIQAPPFERGDHVEEGCARRALFAALVIAVPSLPVAAQTSADTKEEKKAAKAEAKAKKKGERTAAKLRQKQCGEEWKDARKAGKVEKYMTWPKYYSECNKRLKEKAA